MECSHPHHTKTRLKHLQKAHDFLCAKSTRYHNWHHHPLSSHIHKGALALYCLGIIALSLLVLSPDGQVIKASGSPTAILGTATVINTSSSLVFDAGTYHSDAIIDNFSRQMSGYAWSKDLGWISFGSTNNPAGPVTADRNGLLSGKAKALSGGYIDFNLAPTNSAVTINSSGTFTGYAWSDDVGWLNFTGVTAPGYHPDLLVPDNPSPVTGRDTSGGSNTLTSGSWYHYTAPYFSWSTPADHADIITPAGVAGYYVYFGTSNSADPFSAGAYQTTTNYTASGLSNGNTYYLRISTKDNAENRSDPATLFTYKFDSTNPSNPLIISVSPSGYTSVNSYTFLWPATGSSAASDAGAPTTGSDVAGYQYKTGASSGQYSSWSDTTAQTTVTLDTLAYQEGANTFYLRTVDAAGNTSTPITTTFYYAGNAPTAPQNLVAIPTTSEGSQADSNAFSFTWDAPASFNGSIKQYHYSINVLPTLSNTSISTNASLPSGPYATQQGKNTLYVVAEDIAGNVNYNVYASVDFYATTPAPGAPMTVATVDGSNRDLKDYKVFLTWTEPLSKGTGFAGYEVYRSTDNTTFTSIGTTTGTTYADTGLESKVYYYYLKSKDNAGQYSAMSSKVSITPTGKYMQAPRLSEQPSATPKAFSAVIAWETDRESSSFIEYGITKDKIGKENGGKTIGALEQTKKHSVSIDGLQPDTMYHYRAIWLDSDGNQGESDVFTVKTGPAPVVSQVGQSNVTLNSFLVTWQTNVASSCNINFGGSTAYGGSTSELAGALASSHSLNLTGLSDSTNYHFRANCTDEDGNLFTSDDYVQATLTKPIISGLRFESVKDAPTSSLRFTWTTNVPTTSIVYFQSNNATTKSQSDADYKTSHDITVKDLVDHSTYALTAKGVDQFGNSVESDKNSFTTPNDSRPPKVKNLTIEIKSAGFGSTQKAQVVATWETDEPGTSQLEYGPGISGADYPQKSKEDAALSTSHVVIASDLEPSKIYHLRAVSRDASGNTGYSDDTTTITGKVQQSVVDIIINSLQNSLGWMFNLFGSKH
jgi:hypothetical protein